MEEVNISVPEVWEYLEEQWRGHAALREEGAHTDLLLLCRGGGAVRAHRAGGPAPHYIGCTNAMKCTGGESPHVHLSTGRKVLYKVL